MIIDFLANTTPGLSAGLAYLMQHDFVNQDVGRVDIDGDRIYAIIQDYDTKPSGTGKWEAHRRYWDLQYMVRGIERLYYANIGQLEAGEYVPEKDFMPLKGEGDPLTLREGMVAILSPQDAHMPGMAYAQPLRVRKVVVKVAV